MKEEIQRDLVNLSNTVDRLAEELQDHKNKTAVVLAHLQSTVQSMIDNPATEAVSTAVVAGLLPYVNRIDDNISHFQLLLDSVNSRMNQHYASLEGKVNSMISSDLKPLNTRLDELNGLIRDDLNEVKSES